MTANPNSHRFVWSGSLAMVLMMWGVAARADYPQPVKIAVARLAQERDISEDEVRVDAVEPVDWPDSSLGLAQPGQAYLTVITPGYRVRLSVGDETYVYHTDRRSQVVRATALPRPPAERLEPGRKRVLDPIDPRKLPRTSRLAPAPLPRGKPIREREAPTVAEPADAAAGESADDAEASPAWEPARETAPRLEAPPGSVLPLWERARFLRERWRFGRGRARGAF